MKIDLYRIFFPAGTLLGLWGALVWILYYFKVINYPGLLHPEIMMGGFLLSFVVGFLCTAIPRFTESFLPTKWEIVSASALIFLLLVMQTTSNLFYFHLNSLILFVYLIVFAIRRFLSRKVNPPTPFIFVGLGIIIGLIGSLLLFLSHFLSITDDLLYLGKVFITQGYILSFVLGVGSRLIPSLLGHSPPPNQIQKSLSRNAYFSLGISFLLSYLIEAFASRFIGMILRDLIIIFIAIIPWKIFLLPKRKAVHAFGLWISCWFLMAGHVGASLFFNYKIHFLHLFYIGGLGLMTLIIATRVTLSHGGHDVRLEIKSKILYGLIFLLVLAALTRFSAGFLPAEYQSHLLYAACLWIIGISWWAIAFLPKIIFVKNKV